MGDSTMLKLDNVPDGLHVVYKNCASTRYYVKNIYCYKVFDE